MKCRLWLVVLFLAASCAAPDRPEGWSVQRVTPVDETEELTGVCQDVRTLALGSHADETTLDGTLDELARLAALTGATAALPLLSNVGALATDSTLSAHNIAVQQHDLLVLASRSIDDTTAAACGIPAFSALYATSGFPDCHFEMEIPVAAYTASSTPGTCSLDGRPGFLPCFSDDGDHLTIDCVSDEIVTAAGDRWEPAGSPRVIEIDRVDPDAVPGPEVVRAILSTECRALTDLFSSAPLPNGTLPDFETLTAAVSGLSPAVQDQTEQFINANANPPSFDEFEALVATLDEATVTSCGFPLVSAWAALTTPLTDLPCWTETGEFYPAYAIAPCPGQEDSDEP